MAARWNHEALDGLKGRVGRLRVRWKAWMAMATAVEIGHGKVAGRAPQADCFETTLREESDGAYVGCRLRFIDGGLAQFTRDITDYRQPNGMIVVDESFPTPPEPGDNFVVERY